MLTVLIPFFFISTELQTWFEFNRPEVWAIFGVITIVSVVGKFLGTAIPSYAIGKSSLADASIAGVFM